MSHKTLEAHYAPNRKLALSMGFSGYNCGYAELATADTFEQHQRTLVWRLLDDTPITGESTVLDAGCGIGGPATWIFERYRPRRVIGLEYLWPSVQHASRSARASGLPLHFVQGDAHDLPVADASVDVVFNLESALHYADKDAFIAECRRVLKPGGRLCLGDITTNHKALFAPLTLLNKLPTQFNSNLHLWSDEDYRNAFLQQGLKVVRHQRVSRRVAASLADGLGEIGRRGWAAARGFRARCAYLRVLKALLNSGRLSYDLFIVRRDA
ncbi:MAG TPA: methyltransferase domain-containing protein [Phycisphaerae bacterium]|nr:methyltransferase domain-containing protein [Phycisphaerae bacterium]